MQVFRTIETDSHKIIERVNYPQLEVEEIIEEPNQEVTVKASVNEEELLLQPDVETEVEHLPEEPVDYTEGVLRTVSRHSDSTVTSRQVIRRHIQVSMVKKIHDDEARTSEEDSSSDEDPSEEVEFKPVVRERGRVVRTAVRHTANDATVRQVIRKHEVETEELPMPFAVSDLQRKTEAEEEVVSSPLLSTEVYTEPDMFLNTEEGIARELQFTRLAQRQDDTPSTRRQVIRSVVGEKYMTTAREDPKDVEEEQDNIDVLAGPTSSKDEEGQDLDEDVADSDTKDYLVSRFAIRRKEEDVTHRQVYRIVETEVNRLIEYEKEGKSEEVVGEEVLPEPVYDAQVEEEPDYMRQVFEGDHGQNLASDDDEHTLKRTVVRTPEDSVSRRQVIRRRVQQTESVILRMHSEDEEEESSSEEEDTAVTGINGVYENGINEEEGKRPDVIAEDLPRKFDFLRTAIRQQEHYPVTKRQVYREKEIRTVELEMKNQISADNGQKIEGSSLNVEV